MSNRGSSSIASAEDRRFLQRRVALMGAVVGGSFFGFWLFRLVFGYVIAYDYETASMNWHLAASAGFALPWFLLARGEFSVRFVRSVETVSLLAGVGSVMAMGTFIPWLGSPEHILLVTLTLALVARSIYVPSSAKRTAGLTALVGLGYVGVVYYINMGYDLEVYALVDPGVLENTQEAVAGGRTVYFGVFFLMNAVIVVAASHVLYGLRRQVRDARQLGQYHLDEKMGEGGMGAVYRASHGMLRRPTAVKLLLPDKAGAESVERFEREVQITAALNHPNTITIFDYGHTGDGIFYYAMEFVDGANLDEIVALTGAQSPSRAVHFLSQIAGALAVAHEVGLVHRDIKPANIMVHRGEGVPDLVKVVDFGLVKQLDTGDAGPSLTSVGAITGTPLYISPEAIRDAEQVGPASDIYALGAVAYRLLTGQHVFDATTVVEICSEHLKSVPVPPSERAGKEIPAELERLVLQCLEKEPAARPASAAKIRDQLDTMGIPRWRPAAAAEWWEEFGPALKHDGGSEPSEGSLTVDMTEMRRVAASR